MQGGPPNASGTVNFSGCQAVSERLVGVFQQRRGAGDFAMRKCWGQGRRRCVSAEQREAISASIVRITSAGAVVPGKAGRRRQSRRLQ